MGVVFSRCVYHVMFDDWSCIIKNANKVMLMAEMAYNLKKYLKFTKNRVETVANQVRDTLSLYLDRISARLNLSKYLIFSVHIT